jgi:hypothetical protein
MQLDYVISQQVTKENYRYLLRRVWNRNTPELSCILCNPSRASDKEDDPTTRKLAHIAARHGYGGIQIANLFAWRTPHPTKLKEARNPIGIENDKYLKSLIQHSKALLIAWGNHGQYLKRDQIVLGMISNSTLCLGHNRNGTPKHPGHLSNNTDIVFFDKRFVLNNAIKS